MPSLPRIRRSRARGGSPVISPAPVVHELTASGLTWVNVVSPDVETAQELAERFGWHPLDVEDIVSKRQRPKVDDYEDDGYLFAVLHFPIYDNQVQRLNAAEIDLFVGHDYVVTIPNRELRPVTRLFARCDDDDGSASSSSRADPDVCCTRSSTISSTTASRSSTRSRTSSTGSRTRCSKGSRRRSSATSPT